MSGGDKPRARKPTAVTSGILSMRACGATDNLAIVERVLSGAATRPLALVGRSGCGKSTLLRTAFSAHGVEVAWTTARDLVDGVVAAIRTGQIEAHREAFVNDARPLVVEHLDDLRGKVLTQHELRQLVDARVAQGHAVFLTLTVQQRTDDVAEWLGECAEVVQIS